MTQTKVNVGVNVQCTQSVLKGLPCLSNVWYAHHLSHLVSAVSACLSLMSVQTWSVCDGTLCVMSQTVVALHRRAS